MYITIAFCTFLKIKESFKKIRRERNYDKNELKVCNRLKVIFSCTNITCVIKYQNISSSFKNFRNG